MLTVRTMRNQTILIIFFVIGKNTRLKHRCPYLWAHTAIYEPFIYTANNIWTPTRPIPTDRSIRKHRRAILDVLDEHPTKWKLRTPGSILLWETYPRELHHTVTLYQAYLQIKPIKIWSHYDWRRLRVVSNVTPFMQFLTLRVMENSSILT